MGSRLDKKSTEVRKRIEGHTFDSELGDEYEGSKFGGFSDYFRRKKIKLQNLDADLRARSAHRPQIFRGIVAHVNGYTQPSLNDIHELIVAHGGGFVQYLDGKTMVTHIIASNLTPKKVVEFQRYRIVKPAWIVDSVSAGRLLPWTEYRVVDGGVTQKVLGFQDGRVVSQVNDQTRGYRDQSDKSWYTTQLGQHRDGNAADGPIISQDSLPSGNISFDEDDLARLDAVAQGVPKLESKQNGDDQDIVQEWSQHSSPQAPQSPAMVDALDVPFRTTSVSNVQPEHAEHSSPSTSLKRQLSARDDTPRKAAKLTAEEHNSVLLADPRIRKSTVVNPDFLEQYYRESRLHHLSTWKADLKSQLKALTEETTASQTSRQKRPKGARRYIMHVDFDSFFVAVSLKRCPQYTDKPCVVAHGGGSGSEIASCNYPARKFGVSNGMWMKKAQELCKDLEVLPYDFPAYEAASRKFYEAILATGGTVQSVSIDEALVDISTLCIGPSGTDGVSRNEGAAHREQAKADGLARDLRAQVLAATGCNVSVGIGGNILLAKVALRKAKPAGQFHLLPENALDFIGALQVQNLPGVAWSLGGKLEEIGIKFVKDIRECTKEKLVTKLGPKTGEKLWDYARGIDRVEVGDVVTRKSVSAEVNWGVRFENQEQVDEFIESLCTELEKRLLKEKVKGRQLTLKVMRRAADAPLDPPKHLGHGKCDTFNKSVQLGVYTNDAKIISKETLAIMRGFGFTPGELRGIGVQMQKLEPIKSDGLQDGSQRRLQFKLGERAQSPKRPSGLADDEIETPTANRFRDVDALPIPEGLLPGSPSRRPLNIQGTQFVLPTQVDPSVFAELPEDIRSKLMRQAQKQASLLDISESEDQSDTGKARERQRTDSPAVELPSESQVDPETLAALPDHLRAEVLEYYRTTATKAKNQLLLPQSPRKTRTLPPAKAASSTRRRGKASIFTRASRADNSTLTQSNFISRPQNPTKAPDSGTDDDAPDPDYLAALPADLRAEVLAQHRQSRLRRTAGIDLSLHRKPRPPPPPPAPAPERAFRLVPPRPAAPVFTKAKLSAPGDLRGMVREWTRAFWDEAPFDEDVGAMGAYLRAVVLDEGDLAKAVGVVRWLAWLVLEDSAERWGGDEMRARWEGVLERVRGVVRAAVRDRGLGEVDL